MGALSSSGADGHRPRPGGRFETVYQELRSRILTGRLRPGERVVEAQLASELGVSRTPVREALKRLVAEQLISRDESGALVIHVPSQREVDDIYMIREVLDGLAARIAALRISEDALVRLELSIEAFRDADARGATDELVAANVAFHEVLYDATDNDQLIHRGRELRDLVRLYSREALTLRERTRAVAAEHEAVLAAVQLRSPDEAEAAARAHLRNARHHCAQMLLERELVKRLESLG